MIGLPLHYYAKFPKTTIVPFILGKRLHCRQSPKTTVVVVLLVPLVKFGLRRETYHIVVVFGTVVCGSGGVTSILSVACDNLVLSPHPYPQFDLYQLEWAARPSEDEYLNCFKDFPNDRIMGEMIVQDNMTTAVCREHCVGKESRYYGTQVLNSCHVWWYVTSALFSFLNNPLRKPLKRQHARRSEWFFPSASSNILISKAVVPTVSNHPSHTIITLQRPLCD